MGWGLLKLVAGCCLLLLSGCAGDIAPEQPGSAPRLVPYSLPKPIVTLEVDKSARQMVLRRDGRVFRTYPISLGQNPFGHKLRQGDSRTPEGVYYIDARNPRSRFHLSLRISYPSLQDRMAAAARGVNPGGDIFIHGVGRGPMAPLRRGDWTDGCIAVSNAAIEEIWAMVPEGTRIVIRP